MVGQVCIHLNECAKLRISRPVMVFVHGMWGNAHIFDNWLEQADGMNVPAIAIDLRGHGESATQNGNVGHVGIIDYVDDVISVVKRLGHCYLVGHSMGALIARLAAAKNDDVTKVVSVASAPEAGMMLGGRVMCKMIYPKYMLAMLFGRPFTLSPGDATDLLGNCLGEGKLAFMHKQTGMESGRAAREISLQVVVKDCHKPGLVIGAGMDRITPSSLQRQIAVRHHFKYVEYPDSCHMIPLQDGVSVEAFKDIAHFIAA